MCAYQTAFWGHHLTGLKYQVQSGRSYLINTLLDILLIQKKLVNHMLKHFCQVQIFEQVSLGKSNRAIRFPWSSTQSCFFDKTKNIFLLPKVQDPKIMCNFFNIVTTTNFQFNQASPIANTRLFMSPNLWDLPELRDGRRGGDMETRLHSFWEDTITLGRGQIIPTIEACLESFCCVV